MKGFTSIQAMSLIFLFKSAHKLGFLCSGMRNSYYDTGPCCSLHAGFFFGEGVMGWWGWTGL